MQKQAIRMSDVAEYAGVSIATVSRAINSPHTVSDTTRHKVLAAIDSLGYERPQYEPLDEHTLVGIIVPELNNPIFSAFAHALQTEISRLGFTPLICTQTPGGTSEDQYIDALLAKNANGIIFVSGRHADYLGDVQRYQNLADQHIPFVTINGARPEVPAPDFSTSDKIGIQAAVRHLKNLGHTHIGLLCGQQHLLPADRKIEAFKQVMLAEFQQNNTPIVQTFYDYEVAATSATALVSQGVTAVIAGSDLQALGIIRTLQTAGLSVPDDVSIIGFDDSILMAHLDPALTTVRQPVVTISQSAVQELQRLMLQDVSVQEFASYEYAPDLVVRASTTRPPTGVHGKA